jgi:hypothetical protein
MYSNHRRKKMCLNLLTFVGIEVRIVNFVNFMLLNR